jgi:hypothetical protein
LYSFGNGYAPGSSIEDYLLNEAKKRSTVVYVIKTTPAQDAAAAAAAKRIAQRNRPMGTLVNNCAAISNKILDAAGIPYPDSNCPFCGAEGNPIYWPNMPGTAGMRGAAEGGQRFDIPQGTTQLPSGLIPSIR